VVTAGSPRLPTPVLPDPVGPGVSRTALAALQAHALWALASPAGAEAIPVRLYAAAAARGREHLEAAADGTAYRAAFRDGILPAPDRLTRFAARKRWMADAAGAAIAAGVRQVVVLGAGFDTLGLELLAAEADLLVVEVDRPSMLEAKTLALGTARIPGPWPRSAAVDLADAGALAPALAATGWRVSDPTLFVAEGVLEYLEPEAALALLTAIGELAARESRLACTVRFGDVEDDYVAAPTAAAGEPMRFRPLAAELPRLLETAGLDVVAARGGLRGRRGAGGLLLLATRGPSLRVARGAGGIDGSDGQKTVTTPDRVE